MLNSRDKLILNKMLTIAREQKIKKVVSARQQGIVVLEDIHDPHNAEAVFRTCDSLGFQTVCLIFEQEKRFNPRRVGKASSSSANKWLDFKIYTSAEKCLKELKDEGYEVIATALSPRTENIFTAKIKKSKIALLLGNEHRGLSDKALTMADRTVMIPMQGMVQSLNLSVTAAILLYEITRQRENSGKKKYLLSSREKKSLVESFCLKGQRRRK